MMQCTIIGIGCGGARGFYEDMARVGVGNFILIDGDISSRSNIGSQNGYLSDIGKFKTQVVKNHITDINDKANVKTFDIMLTDELTDGWIEKNVLVGLDKKKTLLCAFTDDFWAQARAESLSQKYQIPYLSAQHHQFGETSEVIYWYPGVSKYTVKDILKSRYEYFQNGNKNTVTSEGSPIFNTTRLNALCDKIATGMLLYGFNEMSDFSSFLRLKPENNLLLIRQKHLAFSESSLRDMFEETDRLMFDDTIWVNPNDICDE